MRKISAVVAGVTVALSVGAAEARCNLTYGTCTVTLPRYDMSGPTVPRGYHETDRRYRMPSPYTSNVPAYSNNGPMPYPRSYGYAPRF